MRVGLLVAWALVVVFAGAACSDLYDITGNIWALFAAIGASVVGIGLTVAALLNDRRRVE